jgi:LPS-assembly lipoprotein
MSSFNRRTLILMPLALAACGFTPAYGPKGPASGLIDQIRIGDPTDKNSFDLVERLEERLGRTSAGRYDLSYTITTDTSGVGIATDNSTTRYQLYGTVEWSLTERATATRVTGGKATGFTSYSATASTVAALSGEENAALRLMHILADEIVTQLVATAGIWAK